MIASVLTLVLFIMMSSAVAIPEQPQPQPLSMDEQSTLPSSPTLKHRLSSSPSPEALKRPRLDTTHTNGSQLSPPSSTIAPSPPQRKFSLVTPVEEKKRNQRLFGGLLSTLSQTTSTKPQHRRRDEIEARQRERLRKDTEERDAERMRRKAETDERRRYEQKRWDEEGLELKWKSLRIMAGCLMTESQPPLYWQPWELKDDEKLKIEKQQHEAERAITEEKQKLGLTPPIQSVLRVAEEGRIAQAQEDQDEPSEVNGHSSPAQAEQLVVSQEDATMKHTDNEATNGLDDFSKPTTEATDVDAEPKVKEDDHAGEELVEGNEDDVIY